MNKYAACIVSYEPLIVTKSTLFQEEKKVTAEVEEDDDDEDSSDAEEDDSEDEETPEKKVHFIPFLYVIVDTKIICICSLTFLPFLRSNFTSLTITFLFYKKVVEAKKRPAEATTSKTASNKKAKFVTPQKSGNSI